MATESQLDNHLLVKFQLQNSRGTIFTCSTRYAITGGTPTATNMPEIAEQLAAGFKDVFAAVLPESCTYVGCYVKYYGGATDLEAYSSSSQNALGTVVSETLPEEDCVVIRKRTGKSGRTHRGRIFVPLVPEDFQVEGRLTDDGKTAYNALAYKFKTVWTFTGTIAAMTGTPKHAAFSAGTLDTITETGIVVDVLNRRDRRDPSNLIYQATGA